MNFSISAKTEPLCKEFLRIYDSDKSYLIDEYANIYKDDSDVLIDNCLIEYRGEKKTHKQVIDEYISFSKSLSFYHFQPPMLVIDSSIRASIYFVSKASECLQFARFFSMKSALLLDRNIDIPWSNGYVAQYMFRCIYFGTATTWYANSFDHILQIVFWGMKLYSSVTDRDGNVYDDAWDIKKTVALCTFEFVVGELKTRGLNDVRQQLITCSTQIEEVRKWSNYIKHKGGVDYKYLEPESPFEMYVMPLSEAPNESASPSVEKKFVPPDERFAIRNFKSPIQIDIDEQLSELQKAHGAIHHCLSEIVKAVDFEAHAVQMKTEDNHNGQA